jgi:iron complex outermembrane receptor protein
VLGGDYLIRARASSVGETLADQPGVSATWFGPQASRPVIRGASGERVQMYQDGSDVLDVSALSNDHAVTLDPLIVDRIEVIRGPATLLYGNAASAGLVNMLTNRIARNEPDRLFGGAVEARGNTGLDERALSARTEFGSRQWRFTADVHRRSTDDVSIPEFGISDALRAALDAAGELPEDTSGRLANSASESRGGGVGISRVGDWGHIGASFSRFSTEYEIPGPGEEEEEDTGTPLESIANGLGKPAALPRQAGKIGDGDGIYIDMGQTRYDLDAEWREPLRGFANLRLRAGWNDYEHREIEPGGELGTVFLQSGSEARLTAEHLPLAGWRGTFGLQYRDLDLEAIGAEAFVPASVTRNIGLFLFEERQFGAWKLATGVRLEQQDIDLPAIASAGYDDTATSGSLGTIWQFSEPLQLALNLTHTERHPTATELYADGPHLAVRRFEIGDGDLGRETALTADLALRGSIGGNGRFSASVFRSDYQDYIFPALTGGTEDGLPVVQYTTTDALFTGVEAEIEWTGIETRAGRLRTRLFADAVRAEDGAGAPLPLIPPLRLGVSAALSRGGLELGLTAIWNDRQSRLGAGELPTEGFTLLDLDLSYRANLAQRPVLLFIRGSNLLDEDARRHASPLKDYAPLPGRALGAGVRFEF